MVGVGLQIGGATLIMDSSGLLNADETRQDIPAGFYACAYKMPDGSIVISYRGTDNQSLNPSPINGGSDILNGWLAATGIITSQMQLALNFYDTVAAANPGATIVTTGHSLGGGLAQAVSIATGCQGVGFDWMPGDLPGIVLSQQTGNTACLTNFTGYYTTGEALQFVRNGTAGPRPGEGRGKDQRNLILHFNRKIRNALFSCSKRAICWSV